MTNALLGTKPIYRSALPRLGPYFVFAMPLFAGVATFRGEKYSIQGLNYTGFIWLFALVVAVSFIAIEKGLVPGKRIYFPVTLWMPWLCLTWASLVWTASPGPTQIRDGLMQSMPVIVGTAASLFITTTKQLEQLVRAYYFTIPMLWISVAIWAAFGLHDEVNYVEVRGISLTAALIGGLAIAGTERSQWGWWIWSICLAITVVTQSRTATLGVLLLPIINPTWRGTVKRLLILLSMAAIGLALLMTPTFHQRFFGDEQKGLGDLAAGDFDSAGRFDAWPLIWQDAITRPLIGHGIGTVQRLVPEVWPNMTHPHNDYLRLAYEIGLLGATVFVVILLLQMVIIRSFLRRTDGVVRQAFAACWLGMAIFLIAACTDNPITYNLIFMNPLFALLGATYSVARRNQFGNQE